MDTSEDHIDYDVIIVGAGISGLTAASELMRTDGSLKILVIEARERVGGRTVGIEMNGPNGSKDWFDLGGQWLGSKQKRMLKIVDELGLKTYDQYSKGKKIAQIGCSKARTYDTPFPIDSPKGFKFFEYIDSVKSMSRLFNLVDKSDPIDYFAWKESTAFNNMTTEKWALENCWTRTTRDTLDILSKTLYGAPSNRVNMLYNIAVTNMADNLITMSNCVGDGSQAIKISGGAFQVAQKMADKLGRDKIILNHPIKQIHVDESTGITTVRGFNRDSGTEFSYKCHHVVSTIPPNQCAKISWSPELPHLKRRLFQSANMGSIIKFIVTFQKPFWKDNGMSGEILSSGHTTIPGEVKPLIAAFDATSSAGVPALVGFVNEEYSDMSMEDRCNEVVQDLVRFLGEDAINQFVDYKDKVWSHEEYFDGGPIVYLPPGQMDAMLSIRDPFHNVHFGGTESASNFAGYMEGAVESGLRCAHEVLQCMDKQSLVRFDYLKYTSYNNEFKKPSPPTMVYIEASSPWWRRIFFVSALFFGVYAYSRHYQLSFAARAVKPVENKLVKYFFDITWPT